MQAVRAIGLGPRGGLLTPHTHTRTHTRTRRTCARTPRLWQVESGAGGWRACFDSIFDFDFDSKRRIGPVQFSAVDVEV